MTVQTKVGNGVSLLSPADVQTWLQSGERGVFIGDVLDETNSEALGVGFARYAPGASNEWLVSYDEVLVVTSGAFSVTSGDGRKTARAGELIFLRRGTKLEYSAGDEGAEVVYVMHPHPAQTELYTEHSELVATFHPVDATPPRFADGPAQDNLALLRRIYDPMESGESRDYGPFFEAMADDVVFQTSIMELHGKEALIGYLVNAGEVLEFDIFERPLEYFAAGDKVVQLGTETFRVKATGAVHRAEWAWVYEFRGGKISRILAIQDLAGIADLVADVGAKAQAAADSD